MEIIKNARAHGRPGGWRCYHGCYRDRDLQERTGGCFRRVPLFAALRPAVPDLGTGGRGISPPSLRWRGYRPWRPARGLRAHTAGKFRGAAASRIMRGGRTARTQAHRAAALRRCAAASHAQARPGKPPVAARWRTPPPGQLCPPEGVYGRTAGIARACRRGPGGAPHPPGQKDHGGPPEMPRFPSAVRKNPPCRPGPPEAAQGGRCRRVLCLPRRHRRASAATRSRTGQMQPPGVGLISDATAGRS